MRIVVIGGTGMIGSKVVAKLGERGHEAVPASPRTGVDTLTTRDGTVRLAPVRFQPIAGEEVATAVSRVAEGTPLNGGLEVAGPERVLMDDFFRDALAAWNDPCQVVTDPEARYFGLHLDQDTLVPVEDTIRGEITYTDWLGR
jgi:uncharacterized protein YbjT (DUF2867 family)